MRRALMAIPGIAGIAAAVLAATALAGQPGGQLPGCEPSHQTPQKCMCPDGHHVSMDGNRRDKCPTEEKCDDSKMKSPCCDSDNDRDDVGCPTSSSSSSSSSSSTTTSSSTTSSTSTGSQTVTVTVTGPPGPPGPAGPAGSNGANGSNGTNGKNGKPAKPCVVTLKSALTKRLPPRFAKVKRVIVLVPGRKAQFHPVLPGPRVRVDLTGLKCGTYGIVIGVPHSRLQPVLRLWTLTGGKGLTRAGFPLPVPPPGFG